MELSPERHSTGFSATFSTLESPDSSLQPSWASKKLNAQQSIGQFLTALMYSVCRLDLAQKKVISFEDFFSRFQKKVISFEDFFSRFHVSESQPRWLDPVTRHSPRMMTALQVHSQLREKARQKWAQTKFVLRQTKFVVLLSKQICDASLHLASRILTLSDFLPTSRGPPSLITKPEFRNMLATLSFHMQEEEFEKLWKRCILLNSLP